MWKLRWNLGDWTVNNRKTEQKLLFNKNKENKLISWVHNWLLEGNLEHNVCENFAYGYIIGI